MSAKASKLVAAAKEWATLYGDFTQGDEAEAYTAVLRAKAAWDKNDADGFADVFIENGSFLVGDEQLVSREQIRDYLKKAFATYSAGSTLPQQPIDIKLISADVALVITDGGVLAAGQVELGPGESTRGVWVVVKQDRIWHLVSLQTSPIKG
jgi:uncharacterized protein (TIGR02246 family)